jgi:hypothetical protein
VAAFLFAAPLLSSSAAAFAAPAAQPQTVWLTFPECPELPFDAAKLVELLRLELEAIGVHRFEVAASDAVRTTQDDGATAWIALKIPSCSSAAEEISLALSNHGTGRETERVMHVADLPGDLRSRAIAIRVVELIRTAWSDLAVPFEPATLARPMPTATPMAPVSPGARPVATPVATSARSTRGFADTAVRQSTWLEGGLAVLAFPSRATGLVGPATTLAYDYDRLRLSVGGRALFGQALASGGSADLGWASGYIGVGARTTHVVLEPRLFLGYAWATGSASGVSVHATTAGGFVLAAALSGGIRSRILRDVDVAIDVEAGHTLVGVTYAADGNAMAGVSGVMLGATIGAAFRAAGAHDD